MKGNLFAYKTQDLDAALDAASRFKRDTRVDVHPGYNVYFSAVPDGVKIVLTTFKPIPLDMGIWNQLIAALTTYHITDHNAHFNETKTTIYATFRVTHIILN